MAVKADETLLGQCLVRAMLATGVTDPSKATKWLAMKVTPKASRVAKFCVLWADAMKANGGEPLGHRVPGDRRYTSGIEAYIARGYSSRAKAYRDQAEFRELFPEYETPDTIGLALLAALDRGEVRKLTPNVAVAL